MSKSSTVTCWCCSRTGRGSLSTGLMDACRSRWIRAGRPDSGPPPRQKERPLKAKPAPTVPWVPAPSWSWQDDAACRGESLDLFFPMDGERGAGRDVRERKAKEICAQCPVRSECLDYAISRPEKYGTWGGLNEDERASERRRRMRRAA